MMLRKRSRPAGKDRSSEQLMAEPRGFSPDAARRHGSASFFSLPGLLVGLAKGMAESDPARSPRSPLDYRVFSGLGGGHLVWSPRSPGADGPRRGWGCDRVGLGLGLIDSLSGGGNPCGAVLGTSPETRSILLGSHRRVNIPSAKTRLDRLLAERSAPSPRSLPNNYVISSHAGVGSPNLSSGSPQMGPAIPAPQMEPGELGKIQSCSSDVVDSSILSYGVLHLEPRNARMALPLVKGTNWGTPSGSLPITSGFTASLSASEIEQSEDYTCIISHGPNPRTTRIFGDCILESHTSDVSDLSGDEHGEEGTGSFWMVSCSEDPIASPAEDFLRACFTCKKQLEGKDIYMYRGEKAFCSCSCRSQEMLVEEEMEEPALDSSDSTRTSSCYEEFFLPGVVGAT